VVDIYYCYIFTTLGGQELLFESILMMGNLMETTYSTNHHNQVFNQIINVYHFRLKAKRYLLGKTLGKLND